MGSKKYSSYAEIDYDLEILKLEKEINYQKMVLSFDKTKESILPSKPLEEFYNIYKKVFSGIPGMILKILIPYVINWFLNKKRGD
ncbi:DUF6327 family protein [Flavobacterium terrisoli]|uniref:DUF6327 family protein n=1 Tax=Flavobacterium terrisoli TaxID=3242195 RepID=UPI0025435BB2|nr:DUF6327 family protein [Flavobacterium buctense]